MVLSVWPAAAQKYPFLDASKVKKFVRKIDTERICLLLWRLIAFDIWATKYNVEL